MLEVWDTTHLRKEGSAVNGLAGAGIPSCFISAKARDILRGDEANGVFEVSVILLYDIRVIGVFACRRTVNGSGGVLRF